MTLSNSNLLSAFTAILLILSRFSAAQNIELVDSCTTSCISTTMPNCKSGDIKCVCDASNQGKLPPLVDCLHDTCKHYLVITTELALLERDCSNAGDIIYPTTLSSANLYAVQKGDIIAGGNDPNDHHGDPDYVKTSVTVEYVSTVSSTTSTFVTTDASGRPETTTATAYLKSTITTASVSTSTASETGKPVGNNPASGHNPPPGNSPFIQGPPHSAANLKFSKGWEVGTVSAAFFGLGVWFFMV